MSNRLQRLLKPLLALLVVGAAACGAMPASAQVLVDLQLNATARPYDHANPPSSIEQQFSVPDTEGRLVMTFVEENYVGGPGGFSLLPVDLSNEYLGWGGSTAYTPHDPLPGQPYKVETTWRHSFSKKMWVARLTARHAYQALQIADRGQQIASRQRLTVEFVPSSPPDALPPAAPAAAGIVGSWDWGAGGTVDFFADGSGRGSSGNSMQWVLVDAAKGVYELRWSHGFVDTATLSPDGNTLTIVNNVGSRFTATRRATPPPAAAGIVGSWDWGAGGTVDFFADGSGRGSSGNSMQWVLVDAAKGVYELRWSHGFVDTATLSPDGNTLTIVNNVGARFTATRRS